MEFEAQGYVSNSGKPNRRDGRGDRADPLSRVGAVNGIAARRPGVPPSPTTRMLPAMSPQGSCPETFDLLVNHGNYSPAQCSSGWAVPSDQP